MRARPRAGERSPPSHQSLTTCAKSSHASHHEDHVERHQDAERVARRRRARRRGPPASPSRRRSAPGRGAAAGAPAASPRARAPAPRWRRTASPAPRSRGCRGAAPARAPGSTGSTSACRKSADQRHARSPACTASRTTLAASFPSVDRRRVDRRAEQAGETVVLALEEEAALDAEQAGEDERRPQHARRQARRLARAPGSSATMKTTSSSTPSTAKLARLSCVRHSMRRSLRRMARAPRASAASRRPRAGTPRPRRRVGGPLRPGDPPAVQDGDAGRDRRRRARRRGW